MNINIIQKNNGLDYLIFREGQNNTVEIYDIAVNSKRRVGVGSEMINELKEQNKNIFAFMRKSNLIAKAFYENNKFKAYHIPKFYPDEDAYLMLWSER